MGFCKVSTLDESALWSDPPPQKKTNHGMNLYYARLKVKHMSDEGKFHEILYNMDPLFNHNIYIIIIIINNKD